PGVTSEGRLAKSPPAAAFAEPPAAAQPKRPATAGPGEGRAPAGPARAACQAAAHRLAELPAAWPTTCHGRPGYNALHASPTPSVLARCGRVDRQEPTARRGEA